MTHICSRWADRLEFLEQSAREPLLGRDRTRRAGQDVRHVFGFGRHEGVNQIPRQQLVLGVGEHVHVVEAAGSLAPHPLEARE